MLSRLEFRIVFVFRLLSRALVLVLFTVGISGPKRLLYTDVRTCMYQRSCVFADKHKNRLKICG